MSKNLICFFLLFSALVTVYPTKREKVNFFNYCYSLEKILTRNSFKKSKNFSNKYKIFAKDILSSGTNKTKGALVIKMIDQYKNSKKLFLINFVPNQFYCLTGYWIEEINPGTFQAILYEKSKEKINQYKNTKKEVDEFIKDINSEYKSIKKEINKLF